MTPISHARNVRASLTAAAAALWLLLIPFGSPKAQEHARQALMRHQEAPLLFDPQRQRPVRYHDNQISIELKKENWNSPEDWKLSVTVERKGAALQQIPLPHEMAQVNEIQRAAGEKAVIVGMLSGDAWVFVVLDLKAHKVVDTVWCYGPVVSPNGRYIAFIKFFPAHFVYTVEDHYMLYDLALNAAQNRPSQSYGISDKVNVGLSVYPPYAGNVPSDNTTVPPETAHFIASEGFFWRQDSTVYVFADQLPGKLNLVMVRLAISGATTSAVAVPRERLCASGQTSTCQVHLSAVQFISQPFAGLVATFRGNTPDVSTNGTLSFPFEQFRDVR